MIIKNYKAARNVLIGFASIVSESDDGVEPWRPGLRVLGIAYGVVNTRPISMGGSPDLRVFAVITGDFSVLRCAIRWPHHTLDDDIDDAIAQLKAKGIGETDSSIGDYVSTSNSLGFDLARTTRSDMRREIKAYQLIDELSLLDIYR
jgi:hypothetical protein